MNRLAQRLIWLDGGAGCAVGVSVLTLRAWLAELYAMPVSLVTAIGVANLVYGAYSSTLALRASRGTSPSRRAIAVLIVGNLGWSVVCAILVAIYLRSASVFGLGQLVLEGLFVGGLALAERKYVLATLG